jgi:hypothetical protein
LRPPSSQRFDVPRPLRALPSSPIVDDAFYALHSVASGRFFSRWSSVSFLVGAPPVRSPMWRPTDPSYFPSPPVLQRTFPFSHLIPLSAPPLSPSPLIRQALCIPISPAPVSAPGELLGVIPERRLPSLSGACQATHRHRWPFSFAPPPHPHDGVQLCVSGIHPIHSPQ